MLRMTLRRSSRTKWQEQGLEEFLHTRTEAIGLDIQQLSTCTHGAATEHLILRLRWRISLVPGINVRIPHFSRNPSFGNYDSRWQQVQLGMLQSHVLDSGHQNRAKSSHYREPGLSERFKFHVARRGAHVDHFYFFG